MPKVVTANTLDTGTVVFLGPTGAWVGAIAEASRYDDAATAEAALAGAGPANVVVDAFVTDAGPEHDGRPKMSLRDTIRAFGPTINFLPSAQKRA